MRRRRTRQESGRVRVEDGRTSVRVVLQAVIDVRINGTTPFRLGTATDGDVSIDKVGGVDIPEGGIDVGRGTEVLHGLIENLAVKLHIGFKP